MILAQLDDLVARGRVTGYTIEEDTRYLEGRMPTLTYRMYIEDAESHLNLGAFAAAMSELGPMMRLSRVQGALGDAGLIRRSKQLCLTAEFESDRLLDEALQIVYHRFIEAPAAAPGSWRYPDVRISGAEPLCAAAVFAHHWKRDHAGAVVLTLDPDPPAFGASTHRVRVLRNWVSFLQRRPSCVAQEEQSLAFSTR